MLGTANNIALIVEYQRAAASGALIYCKYISTHLVFSCAQLKIKKNQIASFLYIFSIPYIDGPPQQFAVLAVFHMLH